MGQRSPIGDHALDGVRQVAEARQTRMARREFPARRQARISLRFAGATQSGGVSPSYCFTAVNVPAIFTVPCGATGICQLDVPDMVRPPAPTLPLLKPFNVLSVNVTSD